MKKSSAIFLFILLTLLAGCGEPNMPVQNEDAPIEDLGFHVLTVTPAHGSEGIRAEALITLTFSDPMDTTTIDTTKEGTLVLSADGFKTALSISTILPGLGGRSVTLRPEEPLAYSTTYTLKITSRIKNLKGEPLAAPYETTFTTRPFRQLLHYISQLQEIPSQWAHDWNHTRIDGEDYLFLCNNYNGTTHHINSILYKWNGTSFSVYQEIPTVGATRAEFFQIGGDHYLAIGQYHDDTTHNINSVILKWDGTRFDTDNPFQEIPTFGIEDWTFFEMDGRFFLAAANYHHASEKYNTKSYIYEWNGSRFVNFNPAGFPGSGTYKWLHFEEGGAHYLIQVNYHNGITRDIPSTMYKWDGSAFAPYNHPIPTMGALTADLFRMDGALWLAVPHHHNDTTYNINSYLYKWEGGRFESYQPIPSFGAVGFTHFTVGADHYLALANYYNTDEATRLIDSVIYRWDGMNFQPFHSIPTIGAFGWEFFTIDNQPFLAVANHSNDSTGNISSFIYKGIVTNID